MSLDYKKGSGGGTAFTPAWATPKHSGNGGLGDYHFGPQNIQGHGYGNGTTPGRRQRAGRPPTGGGSPSPAVPSGGGGGSNPPAGNGGGGHPGGGGGGGNNGGGGGSNGGGANSLFKQAHRDVMLALHPLLQQYKRAGTQAQNQTDQTQARVQSVYGALGSQLGALTDPYQSAMSGISNQLASQLGGLGSSLGTTIQGAGGVSASGPASEQAAAAGVLGAIGSGGLGSLASAEARNIGYNTSAQRQGSEESAITQRNALTDLANFQRDLSQQKTDAFANTKNQILQRLDTLKQADVQNKLAYAQLALSKSGNSLSWAQFHQTQQQIQSTTNFWNQVGSALGGN